jgi:hypothetical protein
MNTREELLFEQVYTALKEAQAHLNYCGYGDSWERECAKEEHLEEHIETALTSYERFMVEAYEKN